jgi:hypothetical protein
VPFGMLAGAVAPSKEAVRQAASQRDRLLTPRLQPMV